MSSLRSSRFGIWLLGLLGAALLRSLNATVRWTVLPSTSQLDLGNVHKPVIFSLWHDRQLLIFPSHRLSGRARYSDKLCALASRHQDGRYIAAVLKRLGIESVAGSSTRGGTTALLNLTKKLREGWDVVLTPDGPKGPRHKVKPGIILLAEETGAPIYPVSYAVDRRWVFNSWDKMFLPKPFARAVLLIGEPVVVPHKINDFDRHEWSETLERAMQHVTSVVDSYDFTRS